MNNSIKIDIFEIHNFLIVYLHYLNNLYNKKNFITKLTIQKKIINIH
jgi:hypothetical protein